MNITKPNVNKIVNNDLVCEHFRVTSEFFQQDVPASPSRTVGQCDFLLTGMSPLTLTEPLP